MESDDPQQPAVGEPVGQQLKSAREKRGLSQKDVADAQHLRVSIIQAIEDGNYDQIDSELFLKGYIRGYARQVGADANALIKLLDLELEPLRERRAQQEQENPLVDIERRRRKKRRVAKVLITIAVLCGIAFAAWKLALEPRMSADAPDEPKISDNVEKVSAAVPESAEGAETPDSIENPEPEPSPELAETGDGVTDVTAVTEVRVSNESRAGNENDDIARNSNLVVDPDVADSTGQTSDSSVVVGNGLETVAAEPPVTEPAGPEAVLRMSFVGDCWVEVTDATGTRLVASLQRAGDELSVSGEAPLKAVIGAVDAVGTMSFDGESIDVTRSRVTNNRTELTLTL